MIYYTKAASGRGLSGVKDAEKDRIIHGYQKSLQINLFAKAENVERRRRTPRREGADDINDSQSTTIGGNSLAGRHLNVPSPSRLSFFRFLIARKSKVDGREIRDRECIRCKR